MNRSGDGVHLGIACFAIGQAALGQLGVRRVSLPYLQEFEPSDARNHSSDAAGLQISQDLGYQAVSDSSPLRKNSPAEVLLAKTV